LKAEKDQSIRLTEQIKSLEVERDTQKTKLQQLRESVEGLEQSNAQLVEGH